MDFESEELARFIEHIKQFVKALLEEDFDIRSAKIVAKIKPIGLKKPLIAYVLFHTFFTINISNQVN